jgi:hypothetical protein
MCRSTLQQVKVTPEETSPTVCIEQARSQKFFLGGGDRHTKKLLFGLRQVINQYSPPGI